MRGRDGLVARPSTIDDDGRRSWSKECRSRPEEPGRSEFPSLMPVLLGLAKPSSPGACASRLVVHVVGSGDAHAPSGPPRHRGRPGRPLRRTGTRFEPGTCGTPSWPACARAHPRRKTDRGRSAHTAHEPANPDRCSKPRDASTLVLIPIPSLKPVAKLYRWREALLIANADPFWVP